MVGPYPAIITVIALLPLVIRWRQATALLFRFGKSVFRWVWLLPHWPLNQKLRYAPQGTLRHQSVTVWRSLQAER